MSYTEAALLESLRLHPPVPVDDREALADDRLPDGTFLPKGTLVAFNPYCYGRAEALWGADVLDFKPERWESTESGAAADDTKTSAAGGETGFDRASAHLKKFSQYQFNTFSGGLRYG
jgi:cytochrome P450